MEKLKAVVSESYEVEYWVKSISLALCRFSKALSGISRICCKDEKKRFYFEFSFNKLRLSIETLMQEINFVLTEKHQCKHRDKPKLAARLANFRLSKKQYKRQNECFSIESSSTRVIFSSLCWSNLKVFYEEIIVWILRWIKFNSTSWSFRTCKIQMPGSITKFFQSSAFVQCWISQLRTQWMKWNL